MTIQKVGVIGAGQMGSGIAHVAALAGRDVVLLDVDAAFVEKLRRDPKFVVNTKTFGFFFEHSSLCRKKKTVFFV